MARRAPTSPPLRPTPAPPSRVVVRRSSEGGATAHSDGAAAASVTRIRPLPAASPVPDSTPLRADGGAAARPLSPLSSPCAYLLSLPILPIHPNYPAGERPAHALHSAEWARRAASCPYLSPADVAWVVRATSTGAPIQYEGERRPFFAPNLSSAIEFPAAVDAELAEEHAAGRLRGPWLAPPMPSFRTTPLGTVPKGATDRRIIEHASYGGARSVNAGIVDFALEYVALDRVLAFIARRGRGALLCKYDLLAAFRQVPVDAGDWELLGLRWRGRYWHRTALPFGLRSSPLLFTKLIDAFRAFIKQQQPLAARRCARVFAYLDDLIAVGCPEQPPPGAPPGTHTCRSCRALALLLRAIGAALGLVFKESKTREFATSLIYRGYLLDTIAGTIALDDVRVARLRASLLDFVAQQSVPLRELQSLCGRLQFAAAAVQPGRMMLMRLCRLTAGDQCPTSWRRITSGCRGDAQWWIRLLATHNGVSLMRGEPWASASTQHVYSDASDLGAGCWWAPHAISTAWLPHEAAWSIPAREAAAIALAVQQWAPQWRGRRVMLHCDAQGTVAAFNLATTRSALIGDLIRSVWWACAIHDVHLRVLHIAGKDNTTADLLSRGQVLSSSHPHSRHSARAASAAARRADAEREGSLRGLVPLPHRPQPTHAPLAHAAKAAFGSSDR